MGLRSIVDSNCGLIHGCLFQRSHGLGGNVLVCGFLYKARMSRESVCVWVGTFAI